MIVRKLRLQRGWSQDQLAQMSGLSIRTIQRVERGQNAGLDSLKSLAAVFEVEISDLQEEQTMATDTQLPQEELQALKYVRDLKGFYSHTLTYVLVVSGLFILNWLTSPGYYWVLWPLLGWGVGLMAHGISVFEVFNFFGADWEKRQVEKRLGRKL